MKLSADFLFFFITRVHFFLPSSLFLWLHQALASSIFFFLHFCSWPSALSLLFLCHGFLLTLCREESFYCTVPITPVKREVEELDNVEEVSRVARLDMHGLPCQNSRGYPFQVLSLDQIFSKYIVHTLLCFYRSPTPARKCGLDTQFAVILRSHHFPYN